MSNLSFEVAGKKWALTEIPTKADAAKTWHAFVLPGKNPSMFGTQVPALGTSLPTSVVIDGETIALDRGLTSATKGPKGATVVVPEADRRNRNSADGTFLPTSIGEERHFSVSISETKAGTWNIKVSVNRGNGSVSPEQRKAAAQARAAANVAAFDQAFATL